MKSILLTSTALIALGGAAFADGHATPGVTFGGSAELGYNDVGTLADDATSADNSGFYWDASLAVTATAALNGGVTASATINLDLVDGTLGDDPISAGDYALKVSSATANLEFGDVDPAERHWDDVDGMEFAGFNDIDVHLDGDEAPFDAILYGNATFGGVTGAISYGVTNGGELDAMQLAAVGTFGNFGVIVAYQDEFGGADAVIGLTGTASVAGADLKVSYGDDGAETSTGVSVAYPVGPVVIGGYYTMNDVAEDNYGVSADYASGPIAVSASFDINGGEDGADDVTEYAVEGSYDLGNGLTVLAGVLGTDVDGDEMDMYAAGTYDLGGGAELLVAYATDGDDATFTDEVGDPEYQEGTTIAVTFSF